MRTLLVFFLICGSAVTAAAQGGDEEATTGKQKKEKAPKAEKGDKAEKADPLELTGRVFARSEFSSVDSGPWTQELKLDSARIGASYRWKDKVRVKATAELAGTPEVKDAFVDLDGPSGLDVRAGYFKVPISVIENASGWDLPIVDRGIIAEILEDGLGLSGRRDGVMVDWEPPAGTFKLGLMLSQSAAVDGTDPARLLEDGGGLMVTGRAEVQLCPCIRLGAHVSNRETVINTTKIERHWAGGVDAEVDLDSIGQGLRLWADVVAGQDHFYAISRNDPQSTFVAAQAVAGWRFGGAKKNTRYVEPFVAGGYFNPSVDLKRDDILDFLIGVNAGLWKRWRVQGQVEVVTAKALRPAGLDGIGKDVNDSVTGTLQVGAAF